MVPLTCLIDDDKIYLFAMKRILKNLGLSEDVLEFSDATEALTYFQNNPSQLPDIVMVDINMPVMDGWEFLERYWPAASNWSSPPKVFMVSSSVDEKDVSKAKKIRQLEGYYVKPMNEASLKAIFSS